MDPHAVCQIAGELLLRAGFTLRHRSLKSEARYYGWPGRAGLLRVAAHPASAEIIDGQRIVARLTFTYGSPKQAQKQDLVLTRDQIEAQTTAAIGRFLIASGSI